MNPQRQAELARVAALEAALTRSRKQAVMAARLAALHKTGRDQAREALHDAQATLERVKALHVDNRAATPSTRRCRVDMETWPCRTIQALEHP